MKPPDLDSSDRHREAELAAATWVVREERGLTAVEQDELSHWLAQDPSHRAAYAERRWAWREFERLAGLPTVLASNPDPDLLAPTEPARPRPKRRRALLWVAPGLAMAACVVGLLFHGRQLDLPSGSPPALSTALAAPCEVRTLEDGTTVQLNRGARLTVAYSNERRRVSLDRGEAHFTVTKDASRPFVVEAAGVAVLAVGTAFNVRLADVAVEVVVTEGQVEVAGPRGATAPRRPLLHARQAIAMPLVAADELPAVATLNESALAAILAWQPRILDFSDLPLAEALESLNRHNPVQVVLGSSVLKSRRVNATIRSDNVEGFVRLLEKALELRAEWKSETEIELHPAR